jgi:hypothetical protein
VRPQCPLCENGIGGVGALLKRRRGTGKKEVSLMGLIGLLVVVILVILLLRLL